MKAQTVMLVVCSSPDLLKDCVPVIYNCEASVMRASILAEVGRVALVKGNVSAVQEAVGDMAEVYCPHCLDEEELLRKHPDCKLVLGIWEAVLQYTSPMTTEEATRLQQAIHSEPEVFMGKPEGLRDK